jgi:NAD(P)H-hydrate epimerase
MSHVNRFAHKGKFGHALLVTGSYGKMGAAVLCAKACLRSGAGLTTCHIPKCGYEIMQAAVPEAMVMSDFNSSIITKIEEDLSKFSCIGYRAGALELRQRPGEFCRKSLKHMQNHL